MFRQAVSDLTVRSQPRIYTPAEEEQGKQYRQKMAQILREFADRLSEHTSHEDAKIDDGYAIRMAFDLPPDLCKKWYESTRAAR